MLTVWHEEGIKEGKLKVNEKLLNKKFPIEEVADGSVKDLLVEVGGSNINVLTEKKLKIVF